MSVVCCGVVDRRLLCSVSRHCVQSAVQISGPAALTSFLVFSFRPSMQVVVLYLELGREQFLPHPV